MGGSTTYGHPYWDETSFAGWLRQYLPVVDDQHSWEVINAGGISYGSYRVAALMEELAQYQPDLFVVYSAHNEFLERRTYSQIFDQPIVLRQVTSLLSRTRIWTVAESFVDSARRRRSDLTRDQAHDLPAEVDEELNHTVGPIDYHRDDGWHANVLANYKTNLQKMVDYRCTQRSQNCLCNAGNLTSRTARLSKSELDQVSQDIREAFQQHMSDGDKALAEAKFAEASQAYGQALQLDDRHAGAHYQMDMLTLANRRWIKPLMNFVAPSMTTFVPCELLQPSKTLSAKYALPSQYLW